MVSVELVVALVLLGAGVVGTLFTLTIQNRRKINEIRTNQKVLKVRMFGIDEENGGALDELEQKIEEEMNGEDPVNEKLDKIIEQQAKILEGDEE